MTTPAIFNPSTILSAPPMASRQPAPAPVEASFSKVLNREIADRQNVNEASEQRAPQQAAPQESAKQSSSTLEAGPQKTAAPASNAKENEPAPAEEGDSAQVDAAVTATDDLLAFVSDIAGVTTGATTDDADKQDDLVLVDPTAGGVTEIFVDPRTMIDVRPLADQRVAPDLAATESTTVRADPALAIAATTAKADSASAAGAKVAVSDEATPKEASLKPAPDFAAMANRAMAGRRAAAEAESTGKPSAQPVTSTSDLQTSKSVDTYIKPAAIDVAAMKLQDSVAPTTAAVMAPMQQAFSTVQAAAGQASEKLTPNVGTAAWDQALGQKVVWMVAGAQTSATMTLNPPDLGPMQIVLNVNNTDATATFVAAQPEVRQALEAAMPRLREMLAEAGIQLGQANVNAGNPNQNQNQNNDGNSAQRASGRGDAGAASADGPVNVTRVQPARGGLGMVDTFA